MRNLEVGDGQVSRGGGPPPISIDRMGRSSGGYIVRKVGRILFGLAVAALALPGVTWAADTAVKAAAGCCCPCCC
jgi:hypothetical protein